MMWEKGLIVNRLQQDNVISYYTNKDPREELMGDSRNQSRN